MSATEGPNVVTNGLVLTVDGANVRSFPGEPTTNAISSAATMSSWTNYYRTTASSTFATEFGTTGYRFINQPSWNGIYRNFNLGSSGTYTFSAWFRYLNGSANNNGATVYVSNYGGGDTATGLNKSLVGVWQRVTRTVNVTSPGNVFFYLISYGGTDNGTGNPDFSSWEVTMPQIEFKSYATPFVNGTRGTTVATGGGWADLSGNNNHGELVNGPTFNSGNGGSLVFDGIDDYINIPSSAIPTGNEISIEIVSAWNGALQNNSIIAAGAGGNQDLSLHLPWSDGNVYWDAGRPFNRISKSISSNEYLGTRHWVCTKNASTGVMQIYLDGNLWHSGSGLTSSLPAVSSASIGRYDNGSFRDYYYKGNIFYIRIYNRALTAQEVAQNFNATRNRFGV
jgi:hypothetical protein